MIEDRAGAKLTLLLPEDGAIGGGRAQPTRLAAAEIQHAGRALRC